MTCLDEAPKGNAPGGETGGAQDETLKDYGKNTTKTVKKQLLPLPGTALTAFLKRYRADLLSSESTREVSFALDCVDYLLSLVEVRP